MKARTKLLVVRLEHSIGGGGYFATPADAAEWLDAQTHYTLVPAGAAKATVSLDATTVTITSGTLPGAIRAGDLWSPDGAKWYTIASITSPTEFELIVPAYANASAVDLLVARPVRYRLVLLPGAHDGAFWGRGGGPVHMSLTGLPGSSIQGTVVNESGAASNFAMRIGRQAVCSLINVRTNQEIGACLGLAGSIAEEPTCILDIQNCSLISAGVDCIYPSYAGLVRISGGFFESCQDVIQPACRAGFFVDRAMVHGLPLQVGSFYLPIQVFSLTSVITLSNSTIVIDHEARGDPINPSVVFGTHKKTVTVTNTDFIIKGTNAASAFLMFPWSGSSAADISITGGKIVFKTTTGTPKLAKEMTYSPTGTLTTSGFARPGVSDGGGTGLTISHT